jgi:FKBP-type peptidyl-prolyl cis-trans isomerase 2
MNGRGEERDSMKTKVKPGDKVRVKYSGLPKHVAAAPQPRRAPAANRQCKQMLEFTAGSDEVIRGISFGVVGMVRGEKKRLTLDPQDAYGAVRRELFKEVPRSSFPERIKLSVGKRLTAIGVASRRRRHVQVVEVKPETVVIDGNHPLAGKTVEVVVELISLASSGAGSRIAPHGNGHKS